MSRGLGRWLAVLTVAMASLGLFAGLASASSSFKLSISPGHVKPGGTVTISTEPRVACTVTVTIAKRPFSHAMPTGYVKIAMPRADDPGRVPVKVTCAGHAETGSFTVSK